MQEEEGEAAQAERCVAGGETLGDVGCGLADFGDVAQESAGDEDRVRDDEEEEDGGEDHDGFAHAAQVEERHGGDEGKGGGEFPGVPLGGEEAEEGIAGGGDGDGDGQDVVDEECAAGENAGLLPEEFAGDDIAAAAVGEEFDDAAVAGGDDEDGRHHECGEKDGEVLMLTERAEGFFGSVGGGGEPVGAEADPGEEGDE